MQKHEFILTHSSKQRLEDELVQLRTVKRPEVTEAIKRAREYGDLSENFEYQAARQAQAILNGRIAEIEALLERSRFVEDAGDAEFVSIGTIVTVRDLEGDEDWELTLVDANSADPLNDMISYSSPVGQALMDKKIGDVIEVTIPAGKVRYEVVSLRIL